MIRSGCVPPAISVTVRPTKLPPPPRFFIAPETNTCRVLSHNLLCHFVIVMRAKCSLALLLSLSGVHFPWDVFIIFSSSLSAECEWGGGRVSLFFECFCRARSPLWRFATAVSLFLACQISNFNQSERTHKNGIN